MEKQQTTSRRPGEYSAENIQVLTGVDHVRLRPAMYIGDVGEAGLHRLVFELVRNSVDEALAGYGQDITVVMHEDGSVSVSDEGRGVPVDFHPELECSMLEAVFTNMAVSLGRSQLLGLPFGVGVTVVNALSERLEVEVCRGGQLYRQVFERARPASALEAVGATESRGTRVRLWPDPEIFCQGSCFLWRVLAERMQELAYLNAGLRLTLKSEKDLRQRLFVAPKGLADWVSERVGERPAGLPEPLSFRAQLDSEDLGGELELAWSLQFLDSGAGCLRSYVNGAETAEGGTHLRGFRKALAEHFREDWLWSAVALLSLNMPQPVFGGSDRSRLESPEAESVVETLVSSQLAAWRAEHPGLALRLGAGHLGAGRLGVGKDGGADGPVGG